MKIALFIEENAKDGTLRNCQRWLALYGDSYQQMTERACTCFLNRFHIRGATARLIEIIQEQMH